MSSTTGRRYLQLYGGNWGLSGEEGSVVLTQAIWVSLGLWLALGQGGWPVREDPSLPWMSLSFTVNLRAFLGQPSVLGSGCPGREASDWRDSDRPGSSALQWQETSCWFSRSARDQEPLRSQQISSVNSWVSPPLLPLPPCDYPVGLDPLVRNTVLRLSHPPWTPPFPGSDGSRDPSFWRNSRIQTQPWS